ncbi:acyclic sesquiterpene synthase-like isoform X2 [Lolium rigidum]|uniref:acyclic sesquiterpene synthase-like isoform X2 n=1 Tax=Lolium rigidum TaxID=89674 RepID=UPI001F5CC530|nr:acyclic sesquiterpene synthase-like isoform X2 [Lolium rigidum]
MAARLVMKLPARSSLTRPSARGSSGRRPFSLPCGVPQMRPSQTNSRQALPRVGVNHVGCYRHDQAELTGMPWIELGLVNGKVEREPRVARTTQQLQPHEPETRYERTVHGQLSMVDVLEKIGISRHFAGETKSILDEIYSCWSRRDEKIMLDLEACAMAFRILRMNGYDVSSDGMSHVAQATVDLNLNDTRSLLELYKASQVSISEDELILDNIRLWSNRLLKERLSSSAAPRTTLLSEVEHALNNPFYTTLDRLEHKRTIERFGVMEHQKLYSHRQTNQNLLGLGIVDFSTSQSVYQHELQHLDSWVKESRLDRLPFARQKVAYFYLSAAGTMFLPELSDARIIWAKNGALTTVVDDFFDVGGSQEELENLTALVEMWDKHKEIEYYSEHVEIVFSAIYNSVNEVGLKASRVQGRDVSRHLIEIWQDLLRNMMAEVEWRETGYVPTPEEYMENAVISFALGPVVLPALYFVGPKITESVVRDREYIELFRLMSTCGRLLNDVQTYEREYREGKLNSVSLLVLQSGGSMTISDARKELQRPIDKCRRDLLRMVLREDSVVPTPCKKLFWNMCKTCHFFYFRGDAFSSPKEKAGAVDAVIHEPLRVPGNLLFDLSDFRT